MPYRTREHPAPPPQTPIHPPTLQEDGAALMEQVDEAHVGVLDERVSQFSSVGVVGVGFGAFVVAKSMHNLKLLAWPSMFM